MNILCNRLVDYLQRKYHCVTIHKAVRFYDQEHSMPIEIWPVIAPSHREGFKHRVIAVPNLGSRLDIEEIALSTHMIFSDLDGSIEATFDNRLKRTASPISTTAMVFTPRILIYTDRMLISYDEVIRTFASFGQIVELVDEAEMYESVFISYGGPDEGIASKINTYLKRKGISTWFFPIDAIPGSKLHRVMHDGVNKHDRVLFICSKFSLSRPGVLNELERVLEREAREGGSDILVPVAIDEFVFKEWRPERSDLADQVRSRVIATLKISEVKTFDESMAKVHEAFKKRKP